MEKFLEGVVATMDFLIYKPLFYFLNSNDEIRPLVKKINKIQSTIRMFLTQRKINKVNIFLNIHYSIFNLFLFVVPFHKI